MRSLEELIDSVRDSRSRQHLIEATTAYNAGAFRAAIVSLWVAVAVDLVGKIRHLAEQGEPAAVKHITDLDSAIAKANTQYLMKFEKELLDVCRDTYELIDARDHMALERLRADRHICAHPAFVSSDQVFEATAELVRAHIATAVDSALRHGSTAGRKAIERFSAETTGVSWFTTTTELGAYLRSRYLDHGKNALKTSLAKVVVKGCIDPPESNHLVWTRLGQTARALDEVAPSLLADALESVIGKLETGRGLTDSQLVQFMGALGDLQPAWAAIPATSLPRFESAVSTIDLATLTRWRTLSVSDAPVSIQRAISSRVGSLNDTDLAAVIAGAPSSALLDEALSRLPSTGSWRQADHRLSTLILPQAAYFTAARMRRLQDALAQASDLRTASGTPPTLEQLWERTRDVSGTLPVWHEIGDYLKTNAPDGDTDGYYGYPQLRARIASGS